MMGAEEEEGGEKEEKERERERGKKKRRIATPRQFWQSPSFFYQYPQHMVHLHFVVIFPPRPTSERLPFFPSEKERKETEKEEGEKKKKACSITLPFPQKMIRLLMLRVDPARCNAFTGSMQRLAGRKKAYAVPYVHACYDVICL